MKLLTCLFILLVAFLPLVIADNYYKPYLHTPSVPDSPELNLYGEYATQLYTGGASYSFPLVFPEGVNGLSPRLSISYSSQSLEPSIVGSAWSLSLDNIYRDINGSKLDTSDDEYFLFLNGNMHELAFVDGEFRTKINYYYRVQNFSDSWIVTLQDGTKYYFGSNNDSQVRSTWYLDFVEDTLGNTLQYSYTENVSVNDYNEVYLDTISYNGDQVLVNFSYEDKSHRRRLYDQGYEYEQGAQLKNVSIFVLGDLFKRYSFTYTSIGYLSALQSISELDAYNTSLYDISFDYFNVSSEYNLSSQWSNLLQLGDADGKDYGVRLVDINNDGLVDMLKSLEGESKKVYLNTGSQFVLNVSWSIPVEFVASNKVDDRGVRFADVNSDGFVDILEGRGSTRRIFINTGSGWIQNTSWSLPIEFVYSDYGDRGSRLAHLNGDGLIDIVYSHDDDSEGVYLHTGSGWSGESWSVPMNFIDEDGFDKGVRVVDINNDGYADLLRNTDVDTSAYINTGSGWSSDTTWYPPTEFMSASIADKGVRFADVNADGLVDLLVDSFILSRDRGAWLNTGYGWSSSVSEWETPMPFVDDGANSGRRLLDINGDGLLDFVVNDGDDEEVHLRSTEYPYLLEVIHTAYGGNQTLNYVKSIEKDTDFGFSVWLVDSMQQNSGQITDTLSYNYSGGSFDYADNEFRGFSEVTEFLPSSTLVHYFHQDDYLKGIEYETHVKDVNSSLLSKMVQSYSYVHDGASINLSLEYIANYLYDGLVFPVITNTSYNYNRFGNYESIIEWGDVAITGDERYYNNTYALNTEKWIVDKLSRTRIFDADFNLVSDKQWYYDTRGLGGVDYGLLAREIFWNNIGNDAVTKYTHDGFGNVLSSTDSLGNVHTYTYDISNVYLASERNALGHITFYEYNQSTGNMNWMEKNNIRTSYAYDSFGRLVSEIKPYDTFDNPSVLYNYDFDGMYPERIDTIIRTTANNSFVVSYYYDGFGNLIQLKTKADDNLAIVKNMLYDGTHTLVSEYLPHYQNYSLEFTSFDTSVPNATYLYDGAGRVIEVIHSDGREQSVSFEQYNITTTNENGVEQTYTLDAFGRIIKIYEFFTDEMNSSRVSVTSYSYDEQDNLIRVIDDAGNVFSFGYDSLGRKISMDDPDLGVWTYAYDSNNNLILQEDSRGERIVLSYDALNRVTKKTSADINISFGYDNQYVGTLNNISFLGNTIGYDYDSRYRLINETQILDGEVFSISFLYDFMDRLISERGPETIDYYYNQEGLVYRIPGFVSDASYLASGQLANKTYVNDLVTSYSYNSSNNRLLSISAPLVQELSYSYDAIGNILSLTDGVVGTEHIMAYDDLNRLRTVSIDDDTYKYSFNSIGNLMKMTHNSTVKYYVYGGSVAHAPNLVIETNSSVDIFNPKVLPSDSKTRTFEVYLINDRLAPVTTSLTVDFGDGNSYVNNSILVNDSLELLVSHTYASGGTYNVSFIGEDDFEVIEDVFGVQAQSLSVLHPQSNNTILEFVVGNTLNTTVTGVNWTCTDNITMLYSLNMTGYQSLYDYIARSYSTPGEYVFSCDIISNDGYDSISTLIDIEGISIENYHVLLENISRRVSSFTLQNNLLPLNTTVTIDSVAENVSLDTQESLFVFVENNYSTDGLQELVVITNSSGDIDVFTDIFTLQGVRVIEYLREEGNTSSIFSFQVRNDWHEGVVNTQFSELDTDVNVSLDHNESLFVFLEKNYTQEDVDVAIVATRDTYQEVVKDKFSVHPLAVSSYFVLSEGSEAVHEVVVGSKVGLQYFDFSLDTEDQLFSSSDLNVSSSDLFIFVETNHSVPKVYRSDVVINNSLYFDSASEVVLG
jgi:YD repeat-containing protein